MSYVRVRKRKKGRTLGPVEIIGREDSADSGTGCQGGVDPLLGPAGVDARRGVYSTRR